jgi:hypothetical protein
VPSPPDPDTVRCPTCRAVQPWSDSCRRCQSDLRMLREFASAYHRVRRSCLAHLRDGAPRAAWTDARACHALAPSDESLRLLAVVALLRGDPATAVALASRGGPGEGPSVPGTRP